MEERISRTSLGGSDSSSDGCGDRGGRDGVGGGEGEEDGKMLQSPDETESSLPSLANRCVDDCTFSTISIQDKVTESVGEKNRKQLAATSGSGDEKLKAPAEGRSLYHSIQQLSLPSSKSSPEVPTKTSKFYKLADFVSSKCSDDQSIQNDEDDHEVRFQERFNSTTTSTTDLKGHHHGIIDLWKGHDGPPQGSTFNDGSRIGGGGGEDFSEEDEDFFRSSDVTDCSDDLSDVEMSFTGSVSHTGSGEEEGPGQSDHIIAEPDPVLGTPGIGVEAKRARVENIIKTMTPSFSSCHNFPPSSAVVVYGKADTGFSTGAEVRRPKRKQYIPQQVDPRCCPGAVDRDQDCPSRAPKVCLRERDLVRSGLQKMEEELMEMQTRYQQLLDRDQQVVFETSDDDDINEFRGGNSTSGLLSSSSFQVRNSISGLPSSSPSFQVSDVNQNDVKNADKEQLRCGSYVRGAFDDVSGSGLEQLAGVLKVEISRAVERLVDGLIAPFMARNNFRLESKARNDPKKTTEDVVIRRRSPDHVTSHDDVTINGKTKKSDSESEDRIKDDDNDRRRTSDHLDHPIKEDLSDGGTPELDEHPVRDGASFPDHQSNGGTPPPLGMMSDQGYPHRSTGRGGGGGVPDLPTRLPSVHPQHRIPIQFFEVPGNDGFDRDGSASTISGKYFFDAQGTRGGGFGVAQPPPPPLPLFGTHAPPLYYPPCIRKFPQNFYKDQEQLEPLPLIVGAPKKPKRTKVIDRVSPRASKSLPHDSTSSTAQLEDLPLQLRAESPGKPSFNHSNRYHHPHPHPHHPGGAVHDAFPHPSLLQFAPVHALHSSSLQQHSKFLQAMYSQMTSIGGQRGDHAPAPSSSSSTAPSPNHKAPHCSTLPPASKSIIPKTHDYDAMTSCGDVMMTVPGHGFTSTLTPMHLRKAKLMFFYVRYPSSSILKIYFPDVKFNKNNTAQLVKWFSNFREFYYIQMEKYARQSLAEGMKTAKDLIITSDSELYRILVVHYNRNCQIEVPDNFRFVVQATLREFFTSIAAEKDQEPSWKKAIYKVIQRMDDPVPDYFKSPNWMERLVDG